MGGFWNDFPYFSFFLSACVLGSFSAGVSVSIVFLFVMGMDFA